MIQFATPDDIPELLELGAAMYAESRYAEAMPWDVDKVEGLLVALLADPDGLVLVAREEGEIVGGFMAAAFEHFFSPSKVAQDYALFVTPDARGGQHAAHMLEAYIAWAKSRDAKLIQVGITTGVNVERTARLYKGLGFVSAGILFEHAEPGRC